MKMVVKGISDENGTLLCARFGANGVKFVCSARERYLINYSSLVNTEHG
jgi:hypothetical protein